MVDLLIAHPILYLILCINSDGTVAIAVLASHFIQARPKPRGALEKPAFATAARAFNINDYASSPGG